MSIFEYISGVRHSVFLSIPLHEYTADQKQKLKLFQTLEIILDDMFIQNSKAFNHPIQSFNKSSVSFTNIWSFLRSMVELMTTKCLIDFDAQNVKDMIGLTFNIGQNTSRIQCMKWLNNMFYNDQTLNDDNFKTIICNLDSAYEGEMLRIRWFCQISPHLFCIFFYLSFRSMKSSIATLQSILIMQNVQNGSDRPPFTFEFLSKRYLLNMKERPRNRKARHKRKTEISSKLQQ